MRRCRSAPFASSGEALESGSYCLNDTGTVCITPRSSEYPLIFRPRHFSLRRTGFCHSIGVKWYTIAGSEELFVSVCFWKGIINKGLCALLRQGKALPLQILFGLMKVRLILFSYKAIIVTLANNYSPTTEKNILIFNKSCVIIAKYWIKPMESCPSWPKEHDWKSCKR